MKLTQTLLALAAFSLAPSAFAGGILQLNNGSKSLDNVVVSKDGKMVIKDDRAGKPERTTSLVTKGAGIRTATLGIHAYEAELLVSADQEKGYVCDQGKALDSLNAVNGLAIRINVLFSFGKDRLVEALNAGFDSNGVDPENADVKKVLAAIQAGPDAPRGDVIVFAGEKLADGTEAVTYENAAKKDANGNPVAVTVYGAPGLVRAIFSLWLGTTDDGGLKDLNKKLTTCQI